MNIPDMARYEPQLAVQTWHALNRWRETYGLQGLDGEGPRRRNALRQPTLREALRVYGPGTVRRQLADSGVPAPVLIEVFDGGRRRNVRPERVKEMARALNRHLLLTRQRCFEAIANLNAEDDAAVLAVAGIDPSDEAEDDEALKPHRAGYHSSAEGMAALRRSIQLVQDVAEQLASGTETVKLYSDDVDRLHCLGALYGVRPTRQARGRVRLLEMVQRSSVPRTRTPRYWARRTPSAIERHWLHEKQAMGDIHFRENFIVVYAVGYIINLGLGLLTGQVRRCPMPHGEMAHLDHLLGRRPEPAPVCGTYYVTKHDGGHCGRETCRKVHMLLTNEYLLDEARRNRKAELDARA